MDHLNFCLMETTHLKPRSDTCRFITYALLLFFYEGIIKCGVCDGMFFKHVDHNGIIRLTQWSGPGAGGIVLYLPRHLTVMSDHQ